MLECGKNFKGSMPVLCTVCNVTDTEEHRINHCSRFEELNFCDRNIHEKVEFNTIYSDDLDTLRIIIGRINKLWNVKNGHGTINVT